MNPKEAFKTLGVSEDISDDDLKKKYKELAKTHHPDISKDPDKFKTINEAYQVIKDFRENPAKYQPKMPQQGFWSNVVDLGDIFFNSGDFFRQSSENVEPLRAAPITINIDLTFIESVKGCEKEISYKRNIKCKTCDGGGSKQTGNGCDKCDGFGRITIKQGGAIMQGACSKCAGKGVKKEKCEPCGGKRVVEDNRTGTIKIPAGSVDGNILRLGGEGHYIGRDFFTDSYTDVNLKLKVKAYGGMVIKHKNVCSDCSISLLEALQGTTKEIETVYGIKEINIPPKTRHSDQIGIPGCGVGGTNGEHVVTLNVEYPNDIDNIIGVLKNAIPN